MIQYSCITSLHVSHIIHFFSLLSPLLQHPMITNRMQHSLKGRFTLRWRRPQVGQECLVNTWLYEASGGSAGEELKAIKYFLLSWASTASWGQTRNSSCGGAQLQKVPPRRRPCHFTIHEKSSPPLFSSPSVNTYWSRVAFSTNHNWEMPFFSWPADFSTVV